MKIKANFFLFYIAPQRVVVIFARGWVRSSFYTRMFPAETPTPQGFGIIISPVSSLFLFILDFAESSGHTILCPHCNEENDRNEDGTIHTIQFCEECGGDLSTLNVRTVCPKCGASRKRSKQGKYSKFCSPCKYMY